MMMREKLAEAVEQGIVSRAGLIAHGRGEAFDYLLGEATTASAALAEKAAACHLLEAKNPVLCVNGNAAVVAGKDILDLAEMVKAKVEVNLFHRSDERMEKVISYMETLGDAEILGRDADERIKGIASERARCCSQGIGIADVVLVPMEDGDRAEALVSMGKTVIAIDLNPLSRTSKAATVSVVDEASRAIKNIKDHAKALKEDREQRLNVLEGFDNRENLKEALEEIKRSLSDD